MSKFDADRIEEAIIHIGTLRTVTKGIHKYSGKAIDESVDMAIKALEQTDKIDESNFSTEQYKADLQGAYDCGYNSGYADAMSDIAESEE